jgi:hypothetical protein
MRILKKHVLLRLVNSYVVDSPQPANISYLWNFGSLLGVCLIVQILTGAFLAMHYQAHVDFAFNSVEHIMRDVNNGWLIRYTHANVASFFFMFVYMHVGRGLYYSSYKSPRTLVWSIGVIILILMMAIAFLGYVLPCGQMSHWGVLNTKQMILLPIIIKRNLQLSTIINKDIFESNNKDKNTSESNNKDTSKLIEIFIGILDGDGYFDIGPQKQYNKNPNNNPKSTIRIRLGINLQYKDKELLELLINNLGIGKIDFSKSKNQYRLILYKKDILNVIYPYLINNNIEFLTYNRRKQYFLFKYILENNITHWENLNLVEIDNLFQKTNKQLIFTDIINLPYFNNWLVGFTIAEGSFHIKSIGSAHYSIVQSGHENYHIIKAIHYFIKGPEYLNHQIKPESEKVYRISFSSKKDLPFIIDFFETNKLLGLKKLQFDNWKSYIISNNKININSSAPNVILSKLSNNNLLTNINNKNNE